jgi:hypothetical protein
MTAGGLAGLVHSRDRFTSQETQNFVEVVLGGDWNSFSTDDSDLDLSTSAISYYNVSGNKCVRVEVQGALRVEFLKDFYASVNGYDSYISEPVDGQAGNDFGISLSLGWKF